MNSKEIMDELRALESKWEDLAKLAEADFYVSDSMEKDDVILTKMHLYKDCARDLHERIVELERIVKADQYELRQKTYLNGKAKAREKAIDWQADFENHNYSYGELVTQQEEFEKLGRQYGLLKEFRENGIL